MAYRFSEDDVAYLSSPGGDEALALASDLALDGASLIADLGRVRRVAGEHAGAVAETVRLRRRAVERWGRAGDDGVAAVLPPAGLGADVLAGRALSHRIAGVVVGAMDRGDDGDGAAPGSAGLGADVLAGRALSHRIASVVGARIAGVMMGATAGIGAAAGDWLFTDEALQQAPPPAVAAYRAVRLAAWLAESGARGVHDLTCSIGTDLAALLIAGVPAVGSDLDPVRLAMARHNLRRSGLPAPLARADARTVTTRHLLRYADPARRDVTGRRISSADTIPPIADIDAADPAHPPVLRLPPGIDYPPLARSGEIEIVSWNGAVREAVSWPRDLATAHRRATILAGSGIVEQLTDSDPDDVPVTAPDAYLVDPDPAIVRAHLVRQYAARHGLTLLDEHLAYLTGPTPPPGVRAFRITDESRHSERTVRDWVRRDGVGTLEIKQRGTPVIPDDLRRRVRPSGDTRVARTLVIARIGRQTRAFWCQAIPATG